MASLLISHPNPFLQTIAARTRAFQNPPSAVSVKPVLHVSCKSSPFLDLESGETRKRLIDAIALSPQTPPFPKKRLREKRIEGLEGRNQMLGLCGFGYWIQGFRCFPWLALNFHMANNLHFHPSVLQLVQNSGNLPMVAKPLYGILSDALDIGGARRIPYITIGVLLQIISWGPIALAPFIGGSLPTIMACVLLSNLGAALTEVAQDALVAEYGQKHKILGLQSYTFMAIAVAGILGNSLGGVILSRAHAKDVFSIFTALLLLQLSVSLTIKEESLGISQPPPPHSSPKKPLMDVIRAQFSDLVAALKEEKIAKPLIWLVSSIAIVPTLSGSIFCCQTQCLNLDPSVIGTSRVIGQALLLALTLAYDQTFKKIPMRKLIGFVQLSYAFSLLLDFVLVTQMNTAVGVPNDVFALCCSGLAEVVATFKTVPFYVLIASLCPSGCEASLTSFVASALCLSSIFSGFSGIGLAYILGITSGNYTSLPVGILIQFLAALLPLKWIGDLPVSEPVIGKERKTGLSRRSRRNRRIGKVVLHSIFTYRREREVNY